MFLNAYKQIWIDGALFGVLVGQEILITYMNIWSTDGANKKILNVK